MAPIPPIFSLLIPEYKSKTHTSPAGGTFTLTSPHPKVYLLTFDSPPDNRLTPPFLATFCLALDIILTQLPPAVLITTSSISKFYSNGLDYTAAIENPDFMTADLYPLWHRLLTFPMPTIALINGHAFAGGLMTAMAHDYRIMNPHKGFLCLNELDFNAPLTPAMASIFRVKCNNINTFRTLVLEGKRLNALAALEAGLVDGVGGIEEAIKIFVTEAKIDSKLRPLGKGSYGLIKEEMYREILAELVVSMDGALQKTSDDNNERDEKVTKAKKVAEEWVRNGGKITRNTTTDSKAKL